MALLDLDLRQLQEVLLKSPAALLGLLGQRLMVRHKRRQLQLAQQHLDAVGRAHDATSSFAPNKPS